ncbi:dimethyladenosine transferase 2, mitochondrial [Schistocerca serialis cubense]|uniref:dimethyladenosine transferase 2, mitochondrial n=1 Tax=Schistocerca serialis cubense TaxID=2023355 RepID=UPI00214E6A47|nr:dimethyladenosine transferase 2, mitochondrial [Schistocerca serialis cubense]
MLRNTSIFFNEWRFARKYTSFEKNVNRRLFEAMFIRLRPCSLCGGFLRWRSDEPEEHRKRKRRMTQSEEISNYFQTKESLRNVLKDVPGKILKMRRKIPEALYLVDDDVADEIVTAINKEVESLNSPIIEANPGLGLITKRLLNCGAQNLQLYESSAEFKARLQAIEEENRSRVTLYSADILDLAKFKFQDKMDSGSRVETIIKRVPARSWNDEIAFRVVGVLPSFGFLKYLMLSHILQSGLMLQGRPELYVVISPTLYHHLTCNSKASYRYYRSTTVIFQLIFEAMLLSKVPRKAFFPWITRNMGKKKLDEFKAAEEEYMYLVKIVACKDFFEKVVPVEHLQPLWYFLRTHMMSRRNRIVPQLEQWIPGCGPRLIIKGRSIFDQFGDLNPPELLSLFKEFISWPEFYQSNFLSSMETNFMKTELMSDEVDSSSHYPADGDAEPEPEPGADTVLQCEET